jgi:elongation factor P
MLNIGEIKTGKHIIWNGEPFAVLSHEHSKTGRAGAVLRTKLRNLMTGAVLDKTFQGADKLEEAEISKSKAQYLYEENGNYYFMDTESYDQFFLAKNVIGGFSDYLKEGTEVVVINYNATPINIELPAKVTLEVVEAPPGIKGDTVSGGNKQVILETGLKVSAPLFINIGDKLIINTERGTYVSRA